MYLRGGAIFKGQNAGNDYFQRLFNCIMMGNGGVEFDRYGIVNAIQTDFYLANWAVSRKVRIMIIKGNQNERDQEDDDKKRYLPLKEPGWCEHDDQVSLFFFYTSLAAPLLGRGELTQCHIRHFHKKLYFFLKEGRNLIKTKEL